MSNNIVALSFVVSIGAIASIYSMETGSPARARAHSVDSSPTSGRMLSSNDLQKLKDYNQLIAATPTSSTSPSATMVDIHKEIKGLNTKIDNVADKVDNVTGDLLQLKNLPTIITEQQKATNDKFTSLETKISNQHSSSHASTFFMGTTVGMTLTAIFFVYYIRTHYECTHR